jgi:hypothetical protein
MDNLRFADNLDGEAVVALGLPAPRLILAGLGTAGAWALTELPLPGAVRLGAAGLLALTTAALAWGKIQGVSSARWAWLTLRYLGRVASTSREGRHLWVEAESGSDRLPGAEGLEQGPPLVAFLSLRPGVGCTALCRAVGAQLQAEAVDLGGSGQDRSATAIWVVPAKDGEKRPRLLLGDWGSGPPGPPPSVRLAGLVLVWDGGEAFPGQLADQVAALRRTYPEVQVMVALNRAGPASGLSSQIAGAGAPVAAAIPVDERLGDPALTQLQAAARPSADGVRALVRGVLAASRLW